MINLKLKNHVGGWAILEDIYSLRYEVYRKLGWVKSRASKMIKDEFDENPKTTHYAIYEGGRIIGAHRMTQFSEGQGMPIVQDNLSPNLFDLDNFDNTSEGSRYLIKQGKKFPGCAKQLLFTSLNYELRNNSNKILSIGNPNHIDFFKFMGMKAIDREIDCVLDDRATIVLKGVPIYATKDTVNVNIDFNKYDIYRQMYIVTDNVMDSEGIENAEKHILGQI